MCASNRRDRRLVYRGSTVAALTLKWNRPEYVLNRGHSLRFQVASPLWMDPKRLLDLRIGGRFDCGLGAMPPRILIFIRPRRTFGCPMIAKTLKSPILGSWVVAAAVSLAWPAAASPRLISVVFNAAPQSPQQLGADQLQRKVAELGSNRIVFDA